MKDLGLVVGEEVNIWVKQIDKTIKLTLRESYKLADGTPVGQFLGKNSHYILPFARLKKIKGGYELE